MLRKENANSDLLIKVDDAYYTTPDASAHFDKSGFSRLSDEVSHPNFAASVAMPRVKNTHTRISPETKLAKIMMVWRGIDERDLARKTGAPLGSIRNLLSCTSAPYSDLKVKIEKTLQARIWSSPAQFREHLRKR